MKSRTDSHQVSRRCFAQRACTAFRSSSLRSSALTLRHRAAPKPTAVRVIGGGESLRLAMSSSSIARSIRTSAGSPVYLTIDFNRFARRTPIALARSEGTARAGLFLAGLFIRTLVLSCKLYSLSRGGSHERQTRPPLSLDSPECRRDSTRTVTRARAVPVGTRSKQPRSDVH